MLEDGWAGWAGWAGCGRQDGLAENALYVDAHGEIAHTLLPSQRVALSEPFFFSLRAADGWMDGWTDDTPLAVVFAVE
jgi:hypothetical protein